MIISNGTMGGSRGIGESLMSSYRLSAMPGLWLQAGCYLQYRCPPRQNGGAEYQ
jgi:hypothetical protein